MKIIYNVYETDEWFTRSSYSILGVFSSPRAIKREMRKYLSKRTDEFIDEATAKSGACRPISKKRAIKLVIDELLLNNQTFGYTFNYVIETFVINKIND